MAAKAKAKSKKTAPANTASAVGVFVQDMPLNVIAPSPLNPRKHFDDKQLEELAASIKEKGVLQPILVRPMTGKKSATHEIVAGERRWRAARLAGLKAIPAVIRELTDVQALEVAVIENLQRADVHPLEEAAGYFRLFEDHSYTAEVLAEKVGKSPAYVYARLKLNDLIPEAQALFLENTIHIGHAILLARLPEVAQVETVKKGLVKEEWVAGKYVKGTVTVRALDQWIRDQITLELSKAPFSPKDAELVPAAGACATCPKRTGHNPLLFEDLGKKDNCLDRVCYQGKVDAAINARVESGKAVALTTDYNNKQLPRFYEVPEASGKRKCDHAITGIAVDGQLKGETKKVCLEKSCSVHYPKGKPVSSGSDETWQKQQRLREKKRKTELVFRRRVYERICTAIEEDGPNSAISGAPLVAIAMAVYDRLESVESKKVDEYLGIPRERDFGNKHLMAHLNGMPLPDLAALTVKMAAMRDLGSMFRETESRFLLPIAEHYGIEHAVILAEVKAEAKAKGKKKGKAPAVDAGDEGDETDLESDLDPDYDEMEAAGV